VPPLLGFRNTDDLLIGVSIGTPPHGYAQRSSVDLVVPLAQQTRRPLCLKWSLIMANENALLKTATADYDAVVAQLAALRDEMAKLAQSAQSAANSKAHALSQDVTEGMTEAASYLGRKGHNAEVRLENAVSANPYIALGLAAAMGIFLGALARR
jgi:ElaB/YqjD/DUF883 family membrane-anchored ribosome-binding protein